MKCPFWSWTLIDMDIGICDPHVAFPRCLVDAVDPGSRFLDIPSLWMIVGLDPHMRAPFT